MNRENVYRVSPEGKFITKDDYHYGYGIDTQHYKRVSEAREKKGLLSRDHFKESWDRRDGHAIDGTPFHTRYHEYHDLELTDNNTGIVYEVDTVCKHHYFGFYIMLLAVQRGTKSHASILFENISCLDPTIIEDIEENKKRFTIKKLVK